MCWISVRWSERGGARQPCDMIPAMHRRPAAPLLHWAALLLACHPDSALPPDAASNAPPLAEFEIARSDIPLAVALDATASTDPDGRIVSVGWDFGDGTAGEGAIVEHEYAAPGCYQVRLVIADDRGARATARRALRVVAAFAADDPSADVDIEFTGMPDTGALLPRDIASNRAALAISGTVGTPGYEELRARIVRADRPGGDGEIADQVAVPLCSSEFSIELSLVAERVTHKLEIELTSGTGVRRVAVVDDLVAGDVFLVNGQSNASAGMISGSGSDDESPFVRSFGIHTSSPLGTISDEAWHHARSDPASGPGAVGQWPARMAARLGERHGVPVAVINGGQGGQPIEAFLRDDADPDNLDTNYGRLLHRAERAGVRNAVRAIIFYQGEADGSDAQAHRDGFTRLHRAWREDYPNLERIYVTQIRFGCGGAVELREVQRQFARQLPRTSVMSTTGLDGHDGCHFHYADGYRELGDRYADLLGRDLYGSGATSDAEALDVTSATLVGDAIIVETDGDASALRVDPGAEAHFALPNSSRPITDVAADGTRLILNLGPGSDPTSLAYFGHAGEGPWITNAAGVGLLAFIISID